jgi:hypothetical protein
MFDQSFLCKTPEALYTVNADLSFFEFSLMIDLEMLVPAEHERVVFLLFIGVDDQSSFDLLHGLIDQRACWSIGNITNFLLFPVFLLSGAFFPVQNLPPAVTVFSLINPLTYGVDALRGLLIGVSAFSVSIDLMILVAIAIMMIFFGAYSFKTGNTI